MVQIYTFPGCSSCRKMVKWIQDNKIAHTHHYVLPSDKDIISEDVIYKMLKLSINGFEDIISTRSKPYQDIESTYEDMSTVELVDYIVKNPTILRRPIAMDENLLVVGFNQNEITALRPRHMRRYDIW